MTLHFPRLASLALFVFGLGACANRYHVETDAPNYAGVADIAVKVNKTDLREMTLHFEHLAPPRRIDPTLRAYVVWLEVPGQTTTKVGKLDYDEDDRDGDIVATSGFTKFGVLVTLESDPSTPTPGSHVVLRKIVGKG